MEKIVHIVHHIDTEGPLCEPIEEVFKRIENTFNIELNLFPSFNNLKKLQNLEIDLGSNLLNDEVKKIVDPHLVNFNSTWDKVDEMLYCILDEKYRNKFVDDFGNGLIYNWHVIDHVGFITNERRRDLGYLNIFNHYENILNCTKSYKDNIQWHFHPISFFKEAHITATSYDNSMYELHQVISRRIIEKQSFPTVNRAGFHTVRPDSAWFLEQWLPFDASNQSVENIEESRQADAINGRYGDWKGAPSDWSIYKPDIYDWRKKGNSNRYISRVLNLKTRFRNVSKEEISKAFSTANRDGRVYLGITNHDFRDMRVEIEEFQTELKSVKEMYPDVKVKNSTAIEAFCDVIGYDRSEIEENCLDFDVSIEDSVLNIVCKNGEFFGPQPYLAIKTISGDYYHDNLDFGTFKKNYFYTFDRYTLPLTLIDKIGLASNDKYGNSVIIIVDVQDGKVKNVEKNINSINDKQ